MVKTLAVTLTTTFRGWLVLIGVAIWMISTISSKDASGADFVKGEVIVKYRDSAPRDRNTMNTFYSAYGVQSVQRFTGLMEGYERIQLSPDTSIKESMRSILRNPLVEYTQPNYLLSIPSNEGFSNQTSGALRACSSFGCSPIGSGETWPSDPGSTNPTKKPRVKPIPVEVSPPVVDPRSSELYGMKKIALPEVSVSVGSLKKVLVAVIDSGIDYNHEDLARNIWRKGSDRNGDIVGYDFVHNDALPFDDNSHGTHVAGTIGAVFGNGKGLSGVTGNVSLMTLKFLTADGSGTTANAIRAISFAVENGAKILNNSWGGPVEDDNAALLEVVEKTIKRNVLFIAAAGNDESDNDGSNAAYPSAFNTANMVSVAATDMSDRLAFFSNYGKKSVHLAAPGVKILSTVPGNRYDLDSGSSMAAPHVTGAAAMIWGKNPNLTALQVKEILIRSVDIVPDLKEKTITGGRLNVSKALGATP